MDEATPGVETVAPQCPWCSAGLTSSDQATCPSCGATLWSESEPQIPGVTSIAAGTSSRLAKPPKRSRLLQWISGEADDDVAAPVAPPGSLAPPPADVRREIRRLEMEARLTNLSAEASAIAAEDALQARAANDAAGAETALRVAADARVVSDALEAGTLDAGTLGGGTLEAAPDAAAEAGAAGAAGEAADPS